MKWMKINYIFKRFDNCFFAFKNEIFRMQISTGKMEMHLKNIQNFHLKWVLFLVKYKTTAGYCMSIRQNVKST